MMRTFSAPGMAIVIGLLALLAPVRAEMTDADNIRDFDRDNNAIAPGRWAYGWFEGGGIEDKKKDLQLISQAYPSSRLNTDHWAVDPKKKELCWVIGSDGRVWTDRAAMVWIYQIPEKLAGAIRIQGTATSRAAGKRLRLYTFEGDYFQVTTDRKDVKPIFNEAGKEIPIDLTIDLPKGHLVLFVQDDPAASKYSEPQRLQVKLSKATP